jgi:hypothetical protein
LNIQSAEVSDVLKHEGYIEVKESLLDEIHDLKEQISDNEMKNKERRKKI